jgi:hypothetical protein
MATRVLETQGVPEDEVRLRELCCADTFLMAFSVSQFSVLFIWVYDVLPVSSLETGRVGQCQPLPPAQVPFLAVPGTV